MTNQIFQAKDYAYNRQILEKKKNVILVNIEYSEKEDSPKYLNSGLNSIMAKIASKNNNYLGIDLDKISTLSKQSKAIILARIKQNVWICNKTKTRLAIKGLVDDQSKMAFLESLGSSTEQASQAISF